VASADGRGLGGHRLRSAADRRGVRLLPGAAWRSRGALTGTGRSADVPRDRASAAVLLAHIAEFDARKLFVPVAHPSMHSYCVDVLRLSADAAFKRIKAARAAREFPAIFEAVADGRLHLTAFVALAPWLSPENAEELLAAATHRSKSEIEQVLAAR